MCWEGPQCCAERFGFNVEFCVFPALKFLSDALVIAFCITYFGLGCLGHCVTVIYVYLIILRSCEGMHTT